MGAATASAGPGWLTQPAGAVPVNVLGLSVDLGFLDVAPPPDVAAPPKDAVVTSSGLAWKQILRPTCALAKNTPPEVLAKCPRPLAYDKVVVDYTGWVPSGKMFDSSRLEKKTLRVDEVMDGWTEGLQMMSPGETRRFWIPSSLAYGDKPADQGRPAGPLVFDIELYSIQRQPKPPDAPQDVAAAPADAVVTPSGLAYKVLEKGSGSVNPSANSTITVEYSGWKSFNGELFMSSFLGAPPTFKVSEIPLKGLVEGVLLMVEGEKRRFWIPPALALGEKNAKGLPMGMLVFEMSLSKIE